MKNAIFCNRRFFGSNYMSYIELCGYNEAKPL